jgi:hypothetical protein
VPPDSIPPFAVVASEVKDLADQTGRATERVTAQVEQIRAACEEVATVMTRVGETVTEMNGVVDGIAATVVASASLGPGGQDVTGLSRLAERLRSEATGFLGRCAAEPGVPFRPGPGRGGHQDRPVPGPRRGAEDQHGGCAGT